jgi:2'-5' RNA ligase
MRLFIAIPLRPDLAAQLVEAHQCYGDEALGRWSPQHQLHLTLAFLGEQGSAEAVIEIMNQLAHQSCFNIDFEVNSLGALSANILAFMPEPCEALLALQQGLAERLKTAAIADVGISPTGYKPHITLLRARATELPLSDQVIDGFSLGVSQLVLYRSEHVNLPDGGCEIDYQPLHFSYLSV